MLEKFPISIFLFTFFALWLSVKIGAFIRKRQPPLNDDQRADFTVLLGAVLTLLGLIIGFSFSMAMNRYDQRKIYEEAEANAIGTEFVRAELLPADDAAKARGLLNRYLKQRIAFYETRDRKSLEQINRETARLQNDMWSAVRVDAAAHPNAVLALVASGMNDVLNSQGYTQASWWNRIPAAAWSLMGVIAIFSCLLIGNGAHSRTTMLGPVLPLVIAIAFFLIADLDSPRGGLIRVHPQNLMTLSTAMNSSDVNHPTR